MVFHVVWKAEVLLKLLYLRQVANNPFRFLLELSNNLLLLIDTNWGTNSFIIFVTTLGVNNSMIDLLLEVLLELSKRQLDPIDLIHGKRATKFPLSNIPLGLINLMLHISKHLLILLSYRLEVVASLGVLLSWHIEEPDGLTIFNQTKKSQDGNTILHY